MDSLLIYNEISFIMLVDCKKTGGVIYNSGRIYIGAADSKKLLILKEKGYVSLEECEEVSKKKDL